jgi:acyl homoserine lactone synthase
MQKGAFSHLKVIEGSDASYFPKEMDAMFRNRAETFSERLGWDVVVRDGLERDRFDDENPLYLVSVDPHTGEYWGSLRLLPTTGPNMLRDIFAQLLVGDFIESATIWESSRICATTSPEQAGSWQERRQLCSQRTHLGNRRGRGCGRANPNRLRL